MVKTALLNLDVDRGDEFVRALDNSSLDIVVALWMYADEYEDWRLILASPSFPESRRDAYGIVHDVLRKAGMNPAQLPSIWILPLKDPFIRALRRLFGKTRDVYGTRLGLQTIGGRWVEDAFLYRVR